MVSGAALYHFGVSGGAESGVLEIRNTGSGRLYARWPLEDSSRFDVEFTHSVSQSPVRESFKAEDEKLRLESVRFYSYGAGLGGLGQGQTLSRDGDAMIISGFGVLLREFNVIVSDHVLFINNEIIDLRERFGKNAQITIQYR